VHLLVGETGASTIAEHLFLQACELEPWAGLVVSRGEIADQALRELQPPPGAPQQIAEPGARAGSGRGVLFAELPGIQNQWDNAPLLASFFLRSDDLLGPTWNGGTATAVFSNFRVEAGNALAIPEPAAASLCVIGLAALTLRRRR